MIYYMTHIRDTIGNNYLGINIPYDEVKPYLIKLEYILGDKYETYVQHKQNRDNGKYHITVVNVMDYNLLSKDVGMDKFVNSLESVFKYPIDDLKFMGIGTAEKKGNRAYFVVCRSEKLDQIRKIYNLLDHDFHITLGFFSKDVFGVRKNEVIKESEPFFKLLRDLYYKNHETFEFVKEVENFDGDPEKDIEPIEIRDTTATFRNGDNDYFSISLIGDSLRVVAQWQDTEKRPILSNTLISKKFKDI